MPAPLSRTSLPVTVRLPFARMPPPSVPAELSRISESATVSVVPASVEIAPPAPFTAEPAFSSTSWIVAVPLRRSKIRVAKLPLISVWPAVSMPSTTRPPPPVMSRSPAELVSSSPVRVRSKIPSGTATVSAP